ILNMIGRIGRQTSRQAGVVGKIPHALHELGPAAVVLRPIVEINNQGRKVGKPVRHHFPPPPQTIDQTVTGHFGGDTIQKQFIQRWQENAHWGYGGVWVKVVVSGDVGTRLLPPRGKGRTLTLALASIEMRTMVSAASATPLTIVTWSKMASVSGSFFGADSWPLSVGNSPEHSIWCR